MRFKGGFVLALAFCFFSLFFVSAGNDVMAVEVDVLSNFSATGVVAIEVPNYVDFGSVRVGGKSSELQVYVNNTGTVSVRITPPLVDSNEDVFNYLYFRSQKTSNGTAVPLSRIGNFSFSVSKPTTGNTFNDEYFWMILDLSDYNKQVNNDILRHRTDVKFIAVAS